MTLCPRAALLLLALLPPLVRPAGAAQAPPDSTVYRLQPASRLVVKTGKAGLFHSQSLLLPRPAAAVAAAG